MALYSIRLDDATDETLTRLARDRKVTRAAVLREALAAYGKTAGREAPTLERFAGLIGVIKDGPGNLSEQTGAAFARLVGVAARRRSTSAPRPAGRASRRHSAR